MPLPNRFTSRYCHFLRGPQQEEQLPSLAHLFSLVRLRSLPTIQFFNGGCQSSYSGPVKTCRNGVGQSIGTLVSDCSESKSCWRSVVGVYNVSIGDSLDHCSCARRSWSEASKVTYLLSVSSRSYRRYCPYQTARMFDFDWSDVCSVIQWNAASYSLVWLLKERRLDIEKENLNRAIPNFDLFHMNLEDVCILLLPLKKIKISILLKGPLVAEFVCISSDESF